MTFDSAPTACCLLAGLLLLLPYLSPPLLKPLLYIATAFIPSFFLLRMYTPQEHQDEVELTASAAAAPGCINLSCKEDDSTYPQTSFLGFQPHTPAQSVGRPAVTSPPAADAGFTPDSNATALFHQQQEHPWTVGVRAASAPPCRGASDATDCTWHLPMALSLQIWRQESADLASKHALVDAPAVMPPQGTYQQELHSKAGQQQPCFSFPACAQTDTLYYKIAPDHRMPFPARTGNNVLLRALSAPSSGQAADDMLQLCTALSDLGFHSELQLPSKPTEGQQHQEGRSNASPPHTSGHSLCPDPARHEQQLQQQQRYRRPSQQPASELSLCQLHPGIRPRRLSNLPPSHQPPSTNDSQHNHQPCVTHGDPGTHNHQPRVSHCDPTAHSQQQQLSVSVSEQDGCAQLVASCSSLGQLQQQQHGLVQPGFLSPLLRGGSASHHSLCVRWPYARLSAARSPLAVSLSSSGQSVEAAPLPPATNSPLARRLSQRDTGGTPTSPALARLLSEGGCVTLQHSTSLDRPALRSPSSQCCPASDQQLSDKPVAPWASLQLRPVAHLLQQRLQQHSCQDQLPPWCNRHQLQRRHTISDYRSLGLSTADALTHVPATSTAQSQADCSSRS